MAVTYTNYVDPIAAKQKSLYHAENYIRSILDSGKPFINFEYIYGSGVLFRGLTREEVEELYNSIIK